MSDFLKVALDAAKAAEEIILYYYKQNIRVELKEDQSPVTAADRESEKMIIGIVKRAFPDHRVLGEESGDNHIKSEYTWILDPIDGTRNYLKKIPVFGTEIALMKGDEIILGVSNAPMLKETMHAEKGQGAFFNGEQVKVSEVEVLDNAYLTYGNLRFFEGDEMSDLLMLISRIKNDKGYGDFWGYHMVAQGKVDVMVESRLKIWDIAAMKVIVEEAGGKMTDIKGEKINLGTTSCIATNKKLHELVVEHFLEK